MDLLGADGQVQTAGSVHHVGTAQAVAHAGVHYLFPSPREISLLREERRGSWRKINNNLTDRTNLAENVFELSFPLTEEDHKGYHYWMLLEGKNSLSESMKKARAWEVLRNDADCQAVYDRERDRVLFIGYRPTLLVFPEKLIMRTFHPCALVFSFEEDRIEMVAADPTKSLFHLKLAIFKRLLAGTFAEPLPKYSFTLMTIDLPQGPYRGKATGPIHLKPVDSTD